MKETGIKTVPAVLSLLLLCLLSLSMTSVMATAIDPLPPFLTGNRINIGYASYHRHDIPEASFISLPSDEPSFVSHGYFSDPWTQITSSERQELLDPTTRFELYVDGQKVELRKYQCYYETAYYSLYDTTYEDVMTKSFYMQFDAGEFAAGTTHTFAGEWWVIGVRGVHWTVTVTFV